MNCWKYAWFFPTLRDNSDKESPSCATRETIALRAVSIGVSYIIFHRLHNRIFLLQKHRILPIIVEDRQFYLYPLSCRSVLGPRAALRSCAEIPFGGIVRNQSGPAPERKTIMSAFRDRTAIAVDFRHTAKNLGGRRLKTKPTHPPLP